MAPKETLHEVKGLRFHPDRAPKRKIALTIDAAMFTVIAALIALAVVSTLG